MSEPKVLLVTTVKNEGPNILEWVAHHLAIGFTHIQIYQNDSDDETHKHLRTLHKIGVIEYFRNPSKKRDWQSKAYRRASRSESFQKADWCMALDGDEFLHVKTGNGKVQDLLAACTDADEILVHWCFFGNSHKTDLSDELVTERYTLSEHERSIGTTWRGFKSLFRTDAFKRPGIHRAKVPFNPDFILKNGSGDRISHDEIKSWRSPDPHLRQLAQINHYAVRDAASFLLKTVRGSSSHPDRVIELKYWNTNNINDVENSTLSQHRARTWAKMKELDALSRGRLFMLRQASLELWRAKFDKLMSDPACQSLYDDLIKS